MALKFKVDTIGSVLTAMKRAGMLSEEYDLPALKTVNNVCMPSAEKSRLVRGYRGQLTEFFLGLISRFERTGEDSDNAVFAYGAVNQYG